MKRLALPTMLATEIPQAHTLALLLLLLIPQARTLVLNRYVTLVITLTQALVVIITTRA